MPETLNERISKLPVALLLALSLIGCAPVSPVLIAPPTARAPRPDPALMTVPQFVDYSARAQSDMQTWQRMLDGLRPK